MATEAIYKLQPNRTMHLRGFDRRGATAFLTDATATGFKLRGTFSDMADFCVLYLWDADNGFEHYSMRYLPDFDFSGMVLTFDLEYDGGLQPIDSPKFNWIDWATLDIVDAIGDSSQIPLWENSTLQAGSYSVASGRFDLEDNGMGAFDRVTLWYHKQAFDYVVPGKLKTEFQYFAAGAGTVHWIKIAGVQYNYTEVAGNSSADVANGIIALVNAGSGDANATAAVGGVAYAVKLTRKLDTGASFVVDASGGAPDTLWQVKLSTVARALREQVNQLDWNLLGPAMALVATSDASGIDLKAARYGKVNTSGTAVTWSSGDKFTAIAPGSTLYIAGLPYAVASVTSATQLTLTSSAGTQTASKFLAERGGYDGNMIVLYEIHKNNNLKATQSSVNLAGGSSACTWRVSLDFSALGATALRQAWFTFAPRLPDGADYAATEFTATFSNWSVTDPGGKRPLKVAGPGSVRVGSKDAWVRYYGASWVEEASNQPGGTGWFYRGFARRADSTGDKIRIKYHCQQTHDLYLGTSLYSDRGIVSISLDGGAATTLDCYLAAEPPVVTRRKVRTSVGAGEHFLEISVTGTKNSLSTGTFFYFDFLEAAVASDVQDPPEIYSDVSPALDFGTDHTYKLSPARLIWNFDRLGFHGKVNEYISVFWWNNRKRINGTFKTWTVTFGGTWAADDQAFLTIGSYSMGKLVFPADTLESIAKHFVHLVNETFVAVWAEHISGGQLKIHVRTPIWGDTSSTSASSSAGTITTSGDLSQGVEGTWVVDDLATVNPINFGARKWHEDFYTEIAAKGWGAVTSFSMEYVNPPEASGSVWAARYADGSIVETDVGFGSLKTTHCSFVTAVANYQKRAFREIAALMDGAGLVPWLQFGEFLWWFFSNKRLQVSGATNASPIEITTTAAAHGLSSGDRVIVAGVRGNTAANGTRAITVTAPNKFTLNGSAGNGAYISGGEIRAGSMGYYDSETTAAASSALGHALPVFTCQDDDPAAFYSGADADWLAGRLKAHIDTIRSYVLADFPGAKFELLFPYDVNHPNCYHTLDLPYPQGGRMNARVNLPSQFASKSGSGLDRLKVEALSWGSFYRNGDRARESIEFPFTSPQSWSKADTAYLVPIFNGGAAWPAEYLMARNSGVPLINFWAFDHICLLSWPLPLPKNTADAKFV